MSAPFNFLPASTSLRWRCCLGLLVLACLLRVGVPVGYMPTVVQGSLVLSVCSGHQPGAGLLQIIEVNYQTEDLASLDCPYALLAAQALALPEQAAQASSSEVVLHLPRAHGQLSLARAPPPGPPLGSRAPPVSLAT